MLRWILAAVMATGLLFAVEWEQDYTECKRTFAMYGKMVMDTTTDITLSSKELADSGTAGCLAYAVWAAGGITPFNLDDIFNSRALSEVKKVGTPPPAYKDPYKVYTGAMVAMALHFGSKTEEYGWGLTWEDIIDPAMQALFGTFEESGFKPKLPPTYEQFYQALDRYITAHTPGV